MHFLVEQNDLNIRKGIDSDDREHMGVYKRPVFINPDLQTAVQPVQHQRQDQIFACDPTNFTTRLYGSKLLFIFFVFIPFVIP